MQLIRFRIAILALRTLFTIIANYINTSEQVALLSSKQQSNGGTWVISLLHLWYYSQTHIRN